MQRDASRLVQPDQRFIELHQGPNAQVTDSSGLELYCFSSGFFPLLLSVTQRVISVFIRAQVKSPGATDSF